MKKLRNKVFRDAYLAEHVRTRIAYQVTALRRQRGLSQQDLADLTGKQQSVISRIEDPDYGPVKLAALLSIASALDIGLAVEFVSFTKALSSDLSIESMQVESFDKELSSKANFASFHFSPSSNVFRQIFVFDSKTPTIVFAQQGDLISFFSKVDTNNAESLDYMTVYGDPNSKQMGVGTTLTLSSPINNAKLSSSDLEQAVKTVVDSHNDTKGI